MIEDLLHVSSLHWKTICGEMSKQIRDRVDSEDHTLISVYGDCSELTIRMKERDLETIVKDANHLQHERIQ